MIYKVIVPPMHKMGSYSAIAKDTCSISYKEDALIDYNISRDHDGLLPLKSMPVGTKYIPLRAI